MIFDRPARQCLGMPLLIAVCLAALSGCTGTFEARPPTLLVVGFEDAAGPAVGLVRDTFNVVESGENRNLEFIPGSRRALPAPAVSVDVVDRAGARPTAVFLARDPNTRFTSLRGFAIESIDQTDSSAFTSEPSFARVLANGGPDGDEGLLEIGLSDDYCPTEVQVSSSGRYVAVFEERAVCGDTEFRAIYLLDLMASAPGEDPVIARLVSPEPGAAGIFLDQNGDLDPAGRETLYFVDPGAGVRAWDLGSGTSRVLDVTGLSGAVSGLRDIGRVLERLVLVDANRLFLVPSAQSNPEATAVASAESLSELVLDPFGITEQAVLLAGDELVIHPDAREAAFDREPGALPRSAAVLEPIDRFVYLVGDARIDVFDLLEFDGGSVQIDPFTVPEIPSATAITWTRARTEISP